jgi:hypothetical protein
VEAAWRKCTARAVSVAAASWTTALCRCGECNAAVAAGTDAHRLGQSNRGMHAPRTALQGGGAYLDGCVTDFLSDNEFSDNIVSVCCIGQLCCVQRVLSSALPQGSSGHHTRPAGKHGAVPACIPHVCRASTGLRGVLVRLLHLQASAAGGGLFLRGTPVQLVDNVTFTASRGQTGAGLYAGEPEVHTMIMVNVSSQ